MNSETVNKLFKIYRKYSSNDTPSEESQVCMLWDRSEPPDILKDTDQLATIENEFKVEISEDEAVELFDMNLSEASQFIKRLVIEKSE